MAAVSANSKAGVGMVLLPDNHPVCISWQEHEGNQTLLRTWEELLA